jgi:hypothetical protein
LGDKPKRGRVRAATASARRKKIAKEVIEGTPLSTIAQGFGVSRQYINHEVRHPETQHLISQMLRPHHARLERIVDNAISTVDRAVQVDWEERKRRLDLLESRRQLMARVIEERAASADGELAKRAADPELWHGRAVDVPGYRSGLMVRKLKAIGSGPGGHGG